MEVSSEIFHALPHQIMTQTDPYCWGGIALQMFQVVSRLFKQRLKMKIIEWNYKMTSKMSGPHINFIDVSLPFSLYCMLQHRCKNGERIIVWWILGWPSIIKLIVRALFFISPYTLLVIWVQRFSRLTVTYDKARVFSHDPLPLCSLKRLSDLIK